MSQVSRVNVSFSFSVFSDSHFCWVGFGLWPLMRDVEEYCTQHPFLAKGGIMCPGFHCNLLLTEEEGQGHRFGMVHTLLTTFPFSQIQ